MNLPELTVDFKETNNLRFNAHLPLLLRTALDLRFFDALVSEPRGRGWPRP